MALETDTRPRRPTAAVLRRRRTVAGLVLLAFVVIGVLAETIGGGGRSSSPARDADGLRTLELELHRHALSPRTADDRAIARTLAYTPYVSFGGRRRREIALTF